MNTKIKKSTIFVLSCILIASLLGISAAGIPQDQKDPVGDGSGGCTICDKPLCGCAIPPAGYTLTATCTCSSTQCTKTCTYTPRG